MKRLFSRNPLLALAVLAVLFICNYYKDHKTSSALNVSLDKKHWQICVSKGDKTKIYRFDFPEFMGYDNVSLSLENKKIIIRHGGSFVATIKMVCEFDTTSNTLILKDIIGTFPERHDPYGGEDVCRITEINQRIDKLGVDGDSLFNRLTKEQNCLYEYHELPPLQKLAEDFSETDQAFNDLYVYRYYDYAKRYDAIFRTYPISDANHVIYNNMGYYLEQIQAYDAAIYLLSAVLEKYPQRVVAHLNIADTYWGKGERAKAKIHYKEYVSLMKNQKKDIDKIPQRVYNRVENITSFTDVRDGQQYRIVEIGKQTWMAENLNYETDDSRCYYDEDVYCEKYGRLYDWKTAMKICPNGWHLPSDQEWNDLMRAVGGKWQQYEDNNRNTSWGWDGAGKRLKAGSDWDVNANGNGTDDYGFSALPGGSTDGEYFADVKCCGFWWTATKDRADTDKAYARDMVSDNDNVRETTYSKSDGFSVRCVQN